MGVDDFEREFQLETQRLRGMRKAIWDGNHRDKTPCARWLSDIHTSIFLDISGYQAGRIRGPGVGQDRPQFFAGRRAHPRDQVPRLLEGVFRNSMQLLERAPELDEVSVRIVEIFAHLYFIQPFANGNKRTADLFCSWLLCQMGYQRTQVSIITESEYELLANTMDGRSDFQQLATKMIEAGHLVMDPPDTEPPTRKPRILTP